MTETDKRPMAPAPVMLTPELTVKGTAVDAPAYDPTKLPPAAQRALAEAEARRRAAQPLNLPTELGGRDGPEPVRYGDWERKGLAIDF